MSRQSWGARCNGVAALLLPMPPDTFAPDTVEPRRLRLPVVVGTVHCSGPTQLPSRVPRRISGSVRRVAISQMLTRYVGQSGDTKKACCSRYSATRPRATGVRCETAAAGDGWYPVAGSRWEVACGALDEIGEVLGNVDSALGKTFPPIQCVCGQSLGRRPGCEETSAPGPNLTSESVPASWWKVRRVSPRTMRSLATPNNT